MVKDRDIRLYDAIATDRHMMTNVHAMMDDGPFTGLGKRTSLSVLGFEWPEVPNDFQISLEGFFDDEQCFALRKFRFLIDDDECCRRCHTLPIIFRMIHKNKVACFDLVYLVDACRETKVVANDPGADEICHPTDRYWRREPHA